MIPCRSQAQCPSWSHVVHHGSSVAQKKSKSREPHNKLSRGCFKFSRLSPFLFLSLAANNPSAIWERQLLPVQTKSTFSFLFMVGEINGITEMVYSGFARIIVLADSQDFVDAISQIYLSSRKRKTPLQGGVFLKIYDLLKMYFQIVYFVINNYTSLINIRHNVSA